MNPHRFASVEAYNAAFPDCAFPADPTSRNNLRGYQAAMNGITDDVTGTEASLTIDFLPGGAPSPAEEDRVGTVVASRWGEGPLLVLAEQVSLRAAWKAITESWPTRLSEVRTAVSRLRAQPATRPDHAG
ncbi:hypothetical protein BAY61_01455 [Prauserella marina]|uniref:Uncharacterized protein n=1 Tax=Prauserella marina TaxID=530584 RepID=A0A222VJC3_9PSEU|nr:hypothetical protein [Prauserella marina]ASR33873.1 hypothetical protein BAY61_01455 [Prauserella marina]PWV82465.1 hypothetical protein DES30_102708 [Prauserella marina]SDC69832.1 hypothetical protein SAMN05421630_103244 [Prauserella marina]